MRNRIKMKRLRIKVAKSKLHKDNVILRQRCLALEGRVRERDATIARQEQQLTAMRSFMSAADV